MTTATGQDPRGPARSTRGGLRAYWLAFGLLWLLTAAWSLSQPIAAGPDENAHVVKAAAVVRGQLGSDDAGTGAGSGDVTVPYFYERLMTYPICFAFTSPQPASCAPELPAGADAETPTQAWTWVVRNNPVYYAIVGLPSLLPAGPVAVHLMRLLSAALSSAVLAWAFREAATLRRRAAATLGLVAAVTPMVVFLNSIVNPSSLEISAALALWVALTAMVRAPDAERVTSRSAAVAIIGLALALSRGLSPMYLAVIALVVAAAGPWSGVRTLVTDRRTWPWIGGLGVGTVAALAWTMSAGTLEAGGAEHPDLGFLDVAGYTLMQTGDYVLVAIGRFGWMDTPLPPLVMLPAAAVVALPILLGLCLPGRRDRLGVLLALGVSIVLPVLVHAWQARNVGLIWTARYSMPLFVGVPVVAGFALRDTLRDATAWMGRRLLALGVPVLAAVQLAAFLVNVHRYTVGTEGSWRRIFSGDWAPPVSGALLASVVAVVLGVGAWLLLRPQADGPGDPGDPASALPGGEPVRVAA
jgi:hypothetical protein